MPIKSPNVKTNEDRKTRHVDVGRNSFVRSNILTHFIKGKNPLSPMKTILAILGELEFLESMVKLARNRWDVGLKLVNFAKVERSHSLHKIIINKNHCHKTLHLLVEINNNLIEGLVDTSISMLVMSTTVVCKFGMMHLAFGFESYKTTFKVVTQAFSKISKLLVKIGDVQCFMTFMTMDTNNYDLLVGLDFLIKIGVIVGMEKGLIQVRQGPRNNVQILPLNMVICYN